MEKTLKTLYLLIIFILSVIWTYDALSSICDNAKNPPYELSENCVEKETKNSMELFFKDSIEAVFFTPFNIALIPHYIFNSKETESETSSPPPKLLL